MSGLLTAAGASLLAPADTLDAKSSQRTAENR
jgi:hypothetical protein